MKPEAIRAWLEPHFARDTAAGSDYLGGSHGHCAVVALIVRMLLGGELVSATVNGQSHWFNRLDGKDLDLTGDQFGFPPVAMGATGVLHLGARTRKAEEINGDTLRRAGLLLSRAVAPSAPEAPSHGS